MIDTEFSTDIQMAYTRNDIPALINFIKEDGEEKQEAMEALMLISQDDNNPEQITVQIALMNL